MPVIDGPPVIEAGEMSSPAPAPGTRPTRLSLAHNFVWTLAGSFTYAACQWAVIVLLTKVASVELVGQFALATAIAVPIAFLADFRLRVLFVTDVQEKYNFREMLGLRLVLAASAILVVLISCAIVGYKGSNRGVILVVAIAQLVDSMSENFFGLFQRNERMDRIATSQIMRSLLATGAMTLTIYLTHSLILGTLGLFLGKASVLFLYDARYGTMELCSGTADGESRASYFRRIRPAWNLRRQTEMVRVSYPLAIVAVLVSLNGYLPRYVLESLLGRHDLGIYAAMGYIPSGYFMISMALAYVVFARLSKLFATGDLAGFKGLLLKVAGICACLGLGGVFLSVVAGRLLLTIVYRPEYAQYVYLLRWMMLTGAVQCLTTAMQCGLTAASQFRIQVPLFLAVGIVSLIGCSILVPRMGLSGAAVAVLISSTIQLSASTWLVFRTMHRRARDIKNLEYPRFEPVL